MMLAVVYLCTVVLAVTPLAACFADQRRDLARSGRLAAQRLRYGYPEW